MQCLVLVLFIFLIQLSEANGASEYDFDEPKGKLVIALLVIASLVCLFVAVLFFYILYKLWNGRFDRRYGKSISHEKIVTKVQDIPDGNPYSTFTPDPLYSRVNKGHVEETVEQEKDSGIVESPLDVQEDKTEEVLIQQAPPTGRAEMETQELVIVFDNNDDILDVFTHSTPIDQPN